MKRKRYHGLYDIRTVTDPLTGKERKEALYKGAYYRFSMESAQKRKRDFFVPLLLIPALLLFLAHGLLNSPGSRCFYVLPFFLLMAFPLFYACMASFRLFRLPTRFTQMQKEESQDSLLHSSAGLMILSGLYALGDGLFLALGNAKGRLWEELLALAFVVGIGALAAILRRAAKAEVIECLTKG